MSTHAPEPGEEEFSSAPGRSEEDVSSASQRSVDPGDPDGRDWVQGLLGEDYQLRWVIGRGGMSTVWLADRVRDGQQVAIKALRPEFSNAPEFLSRFRNEAQAAQSLDSENVVRTFDYRENKDSSGTVHCFIIMEYVRGESLADLLARENYLKENVALDILEQAAHGLAVIHRRGLVHRDIKPGNLMVTEDGTTKIADFGIAKAAEAVPLTRTGMVVGTAQYVSPEQAQGREVTAASDVYSLGVVGYELLSGRRPFTGDSSVSVVLAHINNPVPRLPNFVSPAAGQLILTALGKDPAHRYADGDEFALAVAAVRRGEHPPAPASGAVAGQAPQPSPTASTEELAAVAQPTTVQPSVQRSARTPDADAQDDKAREGKAVPTRPNRGPGFVLGLVLALIIAIALVGLVWWAAASGALRQEEATTTPPSPSVVTEVVTTSEKEPEVYAPAPETVEPEATAAPTISSAQPEPPVEEAPGYAPGSATPAPEPPEAHTPETPETALHTLPPYEETRSVGEGPIGTPGGTTHHHSAATTPGAGGQD